MKLQYSPPWWRTDDYKIDEMLPEVFGEHAGPHGIAVVRAWADGRTDPGWGLPKPDKPDQPGFIKNYEAGRFNTRRVRLTYEKNGDPFALVMRGSRLVCIDIDGKNGGLTHAVQLNPLPPTLAETSKSGDGYHLFYLVPDEIWDEEYGFAKYADRIGLVQGVDFRGTGCVYHHKTQRWNGRPVADLPAHIAKRLTLHSQKIAAVQDRIAKTLDTQEGHEILMLQDELITQLRGPIPSGRRNNTLFAIGSQLKLAEVEAWEDMVHGRAIEVGLSAQEADKLVANIRTYA
jgi:hypothetical protein